MPDLKDLAHDASAKMALDTVKGAARRALEDLTLTDDEKALRVAERARAARLRRWKVVGGAIVATLVLLALLSLLAKLWAWLMGLALVAGLAYGAWLWWSVRRAVKVAPAADARGGPPSPSADVAAPPEAPEEARPTAKQKAKAIDDELAALKAKLEKG